MSHDIRTPMNAILGMTSVATMHIDEDAADCHGNGRYLPALRIRGGNCDGTPLVTVVIRLLPLKLQFDMIPVGKPFPPHP